VHGSSLLSVCAITNIRELFAQKLHTLASFFHGSAGVKRIESALHMILSVWRWGIWERRERGVV